MMNSLISIIIPVWNGQKYLAEAINSALAQTYPIKEIIIVDDGSTDKSANIAKRFGSSVRYVYQENKGLGAARNTGIGLAQGDYLAFLDHDDLWLQEKLSSQMHALTKANNDPLVFGYVQQFYCPTLSSTERQKIYVTQDLLPGYIAGTLLLSKRRYQQIGPFMERKQVGEFVDWYMRAQEQSLPIIMLDQILLHRRVHNNNMGLQREHYSRQAYLKIIKSSLERRRTQQIETSEP